MNQTIRMLAPMAGALLLLAGGCATAVDGVEGAGEGLTVVRKADFAGRLMYIDIVTSPIPMTAVDAEAAGVLDEATPVIMHFYDDWAVAWYAPEGVALVGNPDNAIRMWHVQGNIHTQSDDVRTDEEPTSVDPTAPPSDANLEMAPIEIESEPSFELPLNQENLLPYAVIDWLEEANLDWQLIAPGFHPGCA